MTQPTIASVWHGATPAAVPDTDPLELGTVFIGLAPNVTIRGARIWAPPGSTSRPGRALRLWGVDGQLYGTLPLPAVLPAGWSTYSLTGRPLAPGQAVVLSYDTNGEYGAVSGVVSTAPHVSLDGAVAIPANELVRNGRFGAPGAFPQVSFQGAYYGVDLVYEHDAEAPPPPPPPPPPAEQPADEVAWPVAVKLRQLVEQALVGAHGGTPAVTAVVPGRDVAIDSCCDGQAWVRIVRTYPVLPAEFPGGRGIPLDPGADPGAFWAVELGAGSARCAPTIDDGGQPPTAADLERSAAELADDAGRIRRAVLCELPNAGGVEAVWIGEQSSVGPSGGCVGQEVLVAVMTNICVCEEA